MTYSIHFSPASADDAPVDDDSAADLDAGPVPVILTDHRRAVWDRIVARVSREVGPVTTDEFLHALTLFCSAPAGHLQLDYDGTSAVIDVAYRYRGPEALAIMTEAYRVGRIVEEESGFEGYDGEVGQHVRTGDVTAAAARLGGVSHWAQTTLT